MYRTLGLDYDERVLPSIANEVLKSVVAQYNAIELIGKREQVCNFLYGYLCKHPPFPLFIVFYNAIELIGKREQVCNCLYGYLCKHPPFPLFIDFISSFYICAVALECFEAFSKWF